MTKFRINGFDQIKAYYSLVFEQKYEIKPQHSSLYVFLINQNNRNNWVEWFKCPFDLAMAGACIGSKKTYYKCLNDLQNWGLIKYEKGVNDWKAPKIKIEVLKCTSTDTATIPQSEQAPTLLPIQAGEQAPTPLPIHIYKLVTLNLELITLNFKQIKNFLESLKDDYEIIFPFTSEKFIQSWELWKTYKRKEHKFNYKSKISEQAALKNLSEISKLNENSAIRIINNSIANGYKGLFEIKEDKKNNTTISDDYKQQVINSIHK